ncbi:MAG: Rrf2 family transcriptional regulator [Planctomycetes bacterium]|nr:Rrf2 family transcriptional regulator [Planctomycetota bacterium]
MRLTLFSDYALRVLLYAGVHDDRLVTVAEIAQAYGISRHHLVKVSQLLIQLGLVESARGRHGGLRLARAPKDIRVGALVRQTEPDLDLVECFDPATNTCPLAKACDLEHLLREARARFLEVLDGYTLADLLVHRRRYAQIWDAQLGDQR